VSAAGHEVCLADALESHTVVGRELAPLCPGRPRAGAGGTVGGVIANAHLCHALQPPKPAVERVRTPEWRGVGCRLVLGIAH